MKDVKSVVAQNLGTLRKQKGLTQAELAERLNYSDKAISRWEKGDTLPDINVLYEICEFYGITMNDLVGEEEPQVKEEELTEKDVKAYGAWICAFAGAAVWLLAAVLYFVYDTTKGSGMSPWIVFLWAIPISCVIVVLFGRPVFNWIVDFVLLSVCVWTLLGSIYLHLIFFSPIEGAYNFWPLFLIGIPAQAILFLMQKLAKYRSKKKRTLVKASEVEENDNSRD
ncbi:MAG: helix-turn-helix transcriptional regulator [Clostridia bacterium]|nr:helix-turn-helix transcriptional regulator [Clostridia bacterium]